jgi:hypothetical protein
LGNQIKYSFFLFFAIILWSCNKPRNGDYHLTHTGTKITTSCPTPANCTTGNEAVFTESVVTVEDSKKYSLEVDGKKWKKDKASVSYEDSFTESYAGGATESFTFVYSGAIKNKFLIEGTYTINSVYKENSAVYSTNTTGNFTLKVKK